MKKMYLKFNLLFLFTVKFFSLFSQEEIPINKETGLVSINNIVKLNDSLASKKKIKEQIDKFIKAGTNLGSSNKLSKKNSNQTPNFISNKTLDGDSIVVYDLSLQIMYLHLSKTAHMDGGDMFQFKLIAYIKNGRFKYDFTNMTHYYAFSNAFNGLTGGKFENEKPDKSEHLFFSDKKLWKSMKLDAIGLIKNIAKGLENFFAYTPQSKQFNF